MPAQVDPLHEFHAFSATHGLILAAFVFITAILCAAGIRLRAGSRLLRAERAAGLFMLGLWCASVIYWLAPPNFRIDEALPLHLCDLTGLIAPLVLITRWRPLRTLLYFWGLGLSIHGMSTPVLQEGPVYLRFWLFWLTHAAIIGTGIYDLVVHRYRPALRDCLFAIGACMVWLVVVLVVNLSLGVNYGYIGDTSPERPTLIDKLGPWPARVFMMTGAAIGLFVTMWLPWAFLRRREQSPRAYGRTSHSP
jgi:hypothetical integral membrane protein (TIGR02206 family)